MVGYAFMGKAHSFAWREASRFFDLERRPQLSVLAGRNGDAVRAAAANLGFADTATDWRELLERPDIDIIDICTPGDSHAEIAIAALQAGKHVLCEKPLANNVHEAEAMVAAAKEAGERGVRSMVGFNYRRVPAAVLARDLVADGRVGVVRHVRATYLQDWIVDPAFPLVWRLQKEHAGSGALGDIGAHIVDLVQYMLGDQIEGVSALTETFIKERPLPQFSSGLSGKAGTERGPVTVDDAALFLVRFGSGAIGTFEATRMATGRKNELRIEINGSDGSIAFNIEAMNELQFYDGTEPAASAGFRRILVTEPEHPYMHAWWPPGHVLGWDHSFVHEIRDFVDAICSGAELHPSFADGLQVQRVLQSVEDSAASNSAWRSVTM
ncbi:MAG: Gfo/Idh/MocA family oxidoreductase [Nakamurella sp.]